MKSDKSFDYVFKESDWYIPEVVSKKAADLKDGPDYFSRLLYEKVFLVRKYADLYDLHKNIMDLGCGPGETLSIFSEFNERTGVDFSERYINYAKEKHRGINFLVGDITNSLNLPMSDLIYSFSTIWSIPDFNAAIKNIYKILNSNGVAIIELGNKRSINAVCSDCYTRENGWAKLFSTTIGSQLKILKKEGFKILEHRSFQILPYYGNKPAFLRFFLHPNWEKIMRKRIKIFKNKMLDEVVSSLPIISKFAFRHIVVLKKL